MTSDARGLTMTCPRCFEETGVAWDNTRSGATWIFLCCGFRAQEPQWRLWGRHISPVIRRPSDEGMYTLEEARRKLKAELCLRQGHDLVERLSVLHEDPVGHGAPRHTIDMYCCTRCGEKFLRVGWTELEARLSAAEKFPSDPSSGQRIERPARDGHEET